MLKQDDQELFAHKQQELCLPLPQPPGGWQSSGLLLFPTRLGEGVPGKEIADA